MKKIFALLIFSALFFVTGAFAAEKTLAMLYKNQVIAQNDTAPAAEEAPAPTAEEESIFPNVVCVDSVTFSLLPKNLDKMIYAESSLLTMVVVPGTEKIDKKNKTITIWANVILTFDGVENITSDYNEYGKELYKDYGYQKILIKFDVKTKKYKIISKTDYKCNGVVIRTVDNFVWEHIIPDSIVESIYTELKKKYKM